MDAKPHSQMHWPFFEDSHRSFKAGLDTWCQAHLQDATHDESRAAVDARCITLVDRMGQGGWLAHAVAGRAHGGFTEQIDTRRLCLHIRLL